jgi:hypothetical protein
MTVPPPLGEKVGSQKTTTGNTKGQQHQGDRKFHCRLRYKIPLHSPIVSDSSSKHANVDTGTLGQEPTGTSNNDGLIRHRRCMGLFRVFLIGTIKLRSHSHLATVTHAIITLPSNNADTRAKTKPRAALSFLAV